MKAANRLRLALIVAMVGVASVAVCYRLYDLQVRRCRTFQIRAQAQHQHTEEVPATRGSIVDREGRELAVTLDTLSLYVHPGRIRHAQRDAELLAQVIDLSRQEILRRLRSDKPFVYLQRHLDSDRIDKIRGLGLDLGPDGPFGIEPEHRRLYPHGPLAVHVVGYANIDGDGVAGIEHELDDELKGDPAVYRVLHDARNGRRRLLIHAPWKQPLDVVLTIDMVLQHIAERELAAAVRQTGARAASAILIEPSTGHLLALANYPAADPNRYGKATAQERVNRAVVHIYEPGSTFKVVSMAAVLEAGSAGADELFFCENGRFNIGRRSIRDSSPHGLLSAQQILEKSSNIGMVKLTATLERGVLWETISRFGFGSKTGVELPGESRGLFAALDDWSTFTRASLSFGQEIGVTALQMTGALAAIANDGVRVPARVLLGTRDAEGRMHPTPPAPSERIISAASARRLRSMMEGVIRSGTGRRAIAPGYRLAGKSGTAQKVGRGGGYSETEFMASFGGFGPVSAPRLAGLVVLDSPHVARHQGGQVAAPVFARIMTAAFMHLRVPEDDDSREVVVARRSSLQPVMLSHGATVTAVETRAGVVPDVRGMSLRSAAAALAARGCRVQTLGRGIVTTQQPSAGTELEASATCHLTLEAAPPIRMRQAAPGRSAAS